MLFSPTALSSRRFRSVPRNCTVVVLALLSAWSLSALAATTIYSTTFDNLISGDSLSGQDGWMTNDPYNPATNAGGSNSVSVIVGYSQSTSDYWAALGGMTNQPPGRQNVTLFRSFSTAGLLNTQPGKNTLQLDTELSIASSSVTRNFSDSFGWEFDGSSGSQIFRLEFVPASTAGYLDVEWFNASNKLTDTRQLFPYNSIYNLSIGLTDSGSLGDTVNVTATDTAAKPQSYTLIKNGQLAAGSAAGVASIAARWDVTDPTQANGALTNYGDNSLFVNDYSVSVVPEPGTAALLLVSAPALLRRRKRSSLIL